MSRLLLETDVVSFLEDVFGKKVIVEVDGVLCLLFHHDWMH